MARAIDADIFIRDLTAMKKMYDAIELDGMIKALKEAPTIDPVKHGYVPIEVVKQIQWERDVAIEQLNSYGVQLGEKAELKRVRHGEWDVKHRHRGGFRKYTGVDEWGNTHTITVDERFESDEIYCTYCGKWNDGMHRNYCPNCGARIDGEKSSRD